VRVKRRVEQPPELTHEQWTELVVQCLTTDASSTDRGGWGCLNKDKMLFRIATLEKERVPNRVIFMLQREGRIALKDNGYYKYVPPVQPRTKRRIADEGY